MTENLHNGRAPKRAPTLIRCVNTNTFSSTPRPNDLSNMFSGMRAITSPCRRWRFHEPESVFPCRRVDLFPDRRHTCFAPCPQVGSGCEWLVGSDVDKHRCSSYRSVLGV